MNWSDLLKAEIEDTYAATDGLMKRVEDAELSWKPATGDNWMTMGQLLLHCTNACGMCCRGFVTGDWGMPEGVDMSDMPPEDMLPSAEKMPTIGSVAEARKLLAEDKQVALKMVAESTEDDLASKSTDAPWDPNEVKLGRRLMQMIQHLAQHKAQLFYYLKLQGKPVNTQTLWGM